MRIRQKYYDVFSYFYDWVIKLHSQDKSLWLRHYLSRKSGVKSTDKVLDLCTGTGALAIILSQYTPQGMVVGLDFSLGMLKILCFKYPLCYCQTGLFCLSSDG